MHLLPNIILPEQMKITRTVFHHYLRRHIAKALHSSNIEYLMPESQQLDFPESASIAQIPKLFFLSEWLISKEISDGLVELPSSPPPVPPSILEPQHIPFGISPAELYANQRWSPSPSGPNVTIKRSTDRLRLGFLSSDFRRHALAIHTVDMFRLIDRTRFQVYCYDTISDIQADWFKTTMKGYCDTYRAVQGMKDWEISEHIQSDSIDIAIDLNVISAKGQVSAFYYRAAPVQVSYLGFAAGTGSSFVDYLVVDEIVAPQEWVFTEKLAYLPSGYHLLNHENYFGVPTKKAHPHFNRGTHVPANTFTFCNLGKYLKIDPLLFHHWMLILESVPNSVLLMSDRKQKEKFTQAAKLRNLDSRVLFVPNSEPLKDHLNHKVGLCDLALDSHNYNGHSALADQIWIGVPFVTFPGENFAGRVATSFAHELRMEQYFVVGSWDQYRGAAIKYASNSSYYDRVKSLMMKARDTSPLFNYTQKVGNFMDALQRMWDIVLEGSAPRTFKV